jgi:hypothetical protein
MFMKEYGCCPKFKRGNNSAYKVELSLLLNFGQQPYSFMHICR